MLNKIYARYLLATNIPRLFEIIQTRQWCEQMFSQWIANLEIQKNNKVLDVGCGPGVLTKTLAQNGYQATGLDQSEAMLTLACRNSRVPLNTSTTPDFKQGDALNLPFTNNKFDVGIAASLINIIPSADKALSEMRRTVKPGGKISFLVPSEKMNPSTAKNYCKENKISGLAASLLQLWSSKAICMPVDKAIALAENTDLENITVHHYLDEMVISVTGNKPI